MLDVQHPAIDRMHRFGQLGTISQDDDAQTCESCNATLNLSDIIVEFQDLLFCDKNCLTEAFADNLEKFGATIKKLT